MKVLVIAPQPFFEPRGTPISIFQRMHGLSELGYVVDLLTIHVGADVAIPNVTIHRTFPVPFIKEVSIGPSSAKLFLDVLLFFKALWMMLRHKYDVIHSHEEAAFYAMVLGWVFRVPHIYDMHSSLPQQLRNIRSGRSKYNKRLFIVIFEFLERMVLKSSGVVLTIGADLRKHIREVVPGINEIQIENTALHNLMQPDPAAVEILRERLGLRDRQAVVYTGNLEPYQGIELLFGSIQELAADYPNLVLLIVGGTDDLIEQYRRKAAELGVGDRTIFAGTVPLHESLEYLELATVLASPRTEGLSVPLKLYSYLHAGKPILVTNIYAHTQALSDETAVIVDATSSGLAQGLRRLLDDETLQRQLGENAQAYVQQMHSMDEYLAKLERAFLAARFSKPVDDVALPMSEEPLPSVLSSN